MIGMDAACAGTFGIVAAAATPRNARRFTVVLYRRCTRDIFHADDDSSFQWNACYGERSSRPNLARFAADPNQPTRQHIHVVVRTPNGNDYGKDLLGQHYLSHPHNS